MAQAINLLLYQLGWFAVVLGAAWRFPWWGMLAACCLIGVHFWLATDRTIELKLVVTAACVGLAIDTLQLWAGIFQFPHGVVVAWLPPPWMSALWMQFATTFRYSMRWLSERYALSACFGLGGAPLAFFAGEKLGAIEFLSPRTLHYLCLALLWAATVPLLVYVADRLTAGEAQRAGYRIRGAVKSRERLRTEA